MKGLTRENQALVNARDRLGFIHFSSFVDADEGAIADKQSRHPSGSRPDFSQAALVYRTYLQRAKALVHVADTGYTYGQFDNSDTVSPALRRFYAISDRNDVRGAVNPFDAEGPVHRFASRCGLITAQPASTTHSNFKMQARYAPQQRIIAGMFRLALRLLGPDRYFNLMRYLSHYSSLLNQGDLLRK